MQLKVFAVRDMKALAFMQPYFSNSLGTAIRAFGDACNESSSPFYKHPEDYVLYEIGTYDDSDATLASIAPVKMLGCASDFVTKKPIVYDPTGASAVTEPVSNGTK